MKSVVLWVTVLTLCTAGGGCKKDTPPPSLTPSTRPSTPALAPATQPETATTQPTTQPIPEGCIRLCAKMEECLKLKNRACLQECQREYKRNNARWGAELSRLEPYLDKPCPEFVSYMGR